MPNPRCLLFGLTVLASVAVPAASAQTDTTATIQRGASLLQAGQFAEAARVLETVTSRQPELPRGWLLLGLARFRTHDYPGALVAALRATTFDPARPAALYTAGLVYAAMDNRDSAFALLNRARATGRIDMTQIASDSDAITLRDDPRFKQLFPAPTEFEHPFVEPVGIIREWRAEGAGDQFGWIARNAGDLDHDGINDVVTSAPTRDVGGPKAGRVYAYSTRTGRLLWERSGQPGDRLGNGVEGAGDVNHDGVPDVIAGAPGGGYAVVYSGRDGSTLYTFTAEDKQDAFGQHTSHLGDVNGDGYADVIIGAPSNGANGAGAGRAYVYSGRDGSILLTLTGERAGDGFGSTVGGGTKGGASLILVGAPGAGAGHTGRTYVYRGLSQTPAFIIESDSTGSALGGMFISVVGDVDHDGTPDVYASDFSNGARGPRTGRVYVYSGKTGKELYVLTGETAGEAFGIGPAEAGDVNHDGYDDLVIGSWQYAGAAPSGGRIYVYSGKDGSLLRTVTGRVPWETLGFDATGMGDVNGDGVPDMLVTSAWSAVNGFHSGRMYVLSGK